MTRLFLAAGVAALAIAAPVSAEKGGPKGGGEAKAERGGGGGQSAKAHRGGGGGQSAKAHRGGGGKHEMRSHHGGGGERKAMRMERGGERKAFRMERRNGGEHRFAQMERGGGKPEKAMRMERREGQAIKFDRQERKAFRADKIDRKEFRAAKMDRKALRGDKAVNRIERRDLREQQIVQRVDRGDRRWNDGDWNEGRFDAGRRIGFAGMDCPPGLANKNPLCMPPGQYKKRMEGQLIPAAYREQMLPVALRDLYRDSDDYYYRYGDGYLYQVDRQSNLISSLLPLIGGGYSVGQLFPTSYMNSYVPDYYRSFYPDTSDDYYRYANGYVYEIDRDSGYIENMIPMYDSGYGVGQMLPASYSYYNVPYQYRDWYQDSDDYYYRYAPGAIYQVDRSSNLITTIAALLTPGGFSVGQQLPMGYDVYNVPYQYRSQYYDTQDSWYRYNNGHIYQVDPTTRLVTAIIQALV